MAKKKAGTLTMAVNVPANSPNPQAGLGCMHGVGRIAGLHTAAHGRTGKQKVFFFFSSIGQAYRTSIKAQNIYTSKLIFLVLFLKNTR
jgi:hypothetical protein